MTNLDVALPHGINPVADVLDALMSKYRLSQTDLAIRSGVSQPAINRILNERAKAKHPRKETLQKIAGALGVTTQQLIGQAPIPRQIMATEAVPVSSWKSLSQEVSSANDKWLTCPVSHGDETFALPVIGEAMIGDDGYREGEIIFLDPGVSPTNGKDVVVLKEKTTFFRRLIITPEGRFLKTLNPNWPLPIMPYPDNAILCGTVIFSGRIR